MNDKTPESPTPWSFNARMCASVLVSLHLFAVFAAPWGSPPPVSDVAGDMSRLVRPYTQSLAIDNGYRFFAPNPEAAHIVRYRLTNADGTAASGEFPDRNKHWPRLLYHRHFMLAESLFSQISAAPDLPPELRKELTDEELASYEWQRERINILLRSLADGLLRENPTAQSVTMTLHEHAIPTPQQVVNGLKLTDPSLYDEGLNLGVFQRESD